MIYAFDISIHALREEGDHNSFLLKIRGRGISIHALREEGDACSYCWVQCQRQFLSTPSARRATT